MAVTQTSNLNFYQDVAFRRWLLEQVPERLIIEQFGIPKTINPNDSWAMELVEFDKFPVSTTPLAEVDPTDDETISYSKQVMTVNIYGSRARLSKKLVFGHQENLPAVVNNLFVDQIRETRDKLITDEIDTSATTRFYSPYPTATQRSEVNAPINDDLVKAVRKHMVVNKVPKITKKVNPANGYSTEPIASSYVWLIPPEAVNDVEALDGFIPYRKYQDRASEFSGVTEEIGYVKGFRFLVVDQLPMYAGAGAGNQDVYLSYALGADAFAYAKHGKWALQNHYVPFSEDHADTYGLVMVLGWSMSYGTKLIRPDRVVVCEHTVS